jgi:hypothetical protein
LNVLTHVASFERPAWSTGILIPASFLCGIIAAVFIWRGGQKTKRTKQVEERLRLALSMDQNDHVDSETSPDQDHAPNGSKVDAAGGSAPAVAGSSPTWKGSDQEQARDSVVDERMAVPATMSQSM